jgi:IS5 family transposase
VFQSVELGSGIGALQFGDAPLCRIDLGREPVPDQTTVCRFRRAPPLRRRFRHLLEEHDLVRQLFDEVQRHLAAKGLQVATGTIVDATIINAPSSTKNAKKARDPAIPTLGTASQP